MGAYLSTLGLAEDDEPQLALGTTSASTEPASFHHPSERDVLAIRTLLLHRLPLELADIILDLAMYWPRIVAHSTQHFIANASDRPQTDANLIYLVTPPILSSQHTEGADSGNRPAKVHMVRFSLSSHDQGWGGEESLQGC
jgi:hypothetical protein